MWSKKIGVEIRERERESENKTIFNHFVKIGRGNFEIIEVCKKKKKI